LNCIFKLSSTPSKDIRGAMMLMFIVGSTGLSGLYKI
jgi:hypothetical protein